MAASLFARAGALGAAAVALAGCATDDGGPASTAQPTLAWVQANVFTKSCAVSGCHGAGSPAAGLKLTDADASRASLVGVASKVADGQGGTYLRVAASDPSKSLLYLVVKGKVGEQRQMPPGLALSPEKVEAIRGWIAAGAPAN